MNSLFLENIKVAFNSVRSHLLRTILTMLIIAFGIMALVGILTAIESIKDSISSNFTQMGANTFSIRNRETRIHIGKHGHKNKHFPAIKFEEVNEFKNKLTFPCKVSISAIASQMATIKSAYNKTNPKITVIGSDENYIFTSGLEIQTGRNFNKQDIFKSEHVAVIGPSLARTLFKKNDKLLNELIVIGGIRYRVIGILKEKGQSMGFNPDDNCIIPLTCVRQYFYKSNMSYTINVMTEKGYFIEDAIGEATGVFRNVRKLRIGMDDNFEIAKSDNIVEMMFDNIKYVTLAATIIGIITLIGASIGLMNIMLVSVSERTREIGVRKAIGATNYSIRKQFLTEAIIICQMGGILGIILGILIGNIMSLITGGRFIIPWFWMLTGVLLCFLVGLISGLYPAVKASRLNPIESLRFE